MYKRTQNKLNIIKCQSVQENQYLQFNRNTKKSFKPSLNKSKQKSKNTKKNEKEIKEAAEPHSKISFKEDFEDIS